MYVYVYLTFKVTPRICIWLSVMLSLRWLSKLFTNLNHYYYGRENKKGDLESDY